MSTKPVFLIITYTSGFLDENNTQRSKVFKIKNPETELVQLDQIIERYVKINQYLALRRKYRFSFRGHRHIDNYYHYFDKLRHLHQGSFWTFTINNIQLINL